MGTGRIEPAALTASAGLGADLRIQAQQALRQVRGERYELMRGFYPGITDIADAEYDVHQPRMQSILIDDGAAAVGKSFETLRLEELGIQLTALRRKGVRETKLLPDMQLQSGDVLVLAGTPEALARWKV